MVHNNFLGVQLSNITPTTRVLAISTNDTWFKRKMRDLGRICQCQGILLALCSIVTPGSVHKIILIPGIEQGCAHASHMPNPMRNPSLSLHT